MLRWPIFVVAWLACVPVFGQLNLKAGYTLALMDAPSHNAILQAHNDAIGLSYADPFTPLDVLHGLDLGIEYRWETVALEFGWRTKRNRLEATGTKGQSEFYNMYSTSLSSFYAGLVQYYGPIRLAASMDYKTVRTKLDFEDPTILTSVKSEGWASTFSLGLVIGGSGPVSLVIAPYVQVQWSEADLTSFQDLIVDLPDPPQPEEYFNYGISLFFLNGPR